MRVSLERHHGKPCYWCKRDMLMGSKARRPTRDHVIPQCMGGTDIVVCCIACNNLKSDMHPAMWLLLLSKRPEVLDRYASRGPRGMALFYDVFGWEIEPHIEKIAVEAQSLNPQWGEVKL